MFLFLSTPSTLGYFLVMHHVGCSIHHVAWNFDTFDMRINILNLIYFACFISLNTFDIGYFIQPCNICMQHAPLIPLTYSGSCKTCFFYIFSFWWESFLNIPIIELTVDLRSNLHIGLSDWVIPLIFADWCPGWPLWGLLYQFQGHLTLKFH